MIWTPKLTCLHAAARLAVEPELQTPDRLLPVVLLPPLLWAELELLQLLRFQPSASSHDEGGSSGGSSGGRSAAAIAAQQQQPAAGSVPDLAAVAHLSDALHRLTHGAYGHGWWHPSTVLG